MQRLKVMSFEAGQKPGIRCKFISEWFKIDAYLPDKNSLLSEVQKNKPDVVLIDPDLYAQIDGIKTIQTIRHNFKIPVYYKD